MDSLSLAPKLNRHGSSMKNLLFLIVAFFSHGSYSEELRLGDFTLSMSKDQILEKKGEPIEKIEQADLITDIFKYLDIDFYFSGESLIGAYSEKEGVCANNNICVGVMMGSASEVWGKAYPKIMQGEEYLEFYKPGEFSCWYRIGGKDKIKSIEIACQP